MQCAAGLAATSETMGFSSLLNNKARPSRAPRTNASAARVPRPGCRACRCRVCSGVFLALINATTTPSGSAPPARWVPRTPRLGCGAQRIGLPGELPGTRRWGGPGALARRPSVAGRGSTSLPWCPWYSQDWRAAVVDRFCGPWRPGFCCPPPPRGTLGSDLCAHGLASVPSGGGGAIVLLYRPSTPSSPPPSPLFFSRLRRGALRSPLPTHIAPWLLSLSGKMLIAYPAFGLKLGFLFRFLGSLPFVEWGRHPVCYIIDVGGAAFLVLSSPAPPLF